MAFSTEFASPPDKKKRWLSLALVISLALNIFGVSWYVTSGVMDSNLPIAKAFQDIKNGQANGKLSEIQLIERITSKLSPEGADLVFQEYALRKARLARLIKDVETAQETIRKEIAKTDIDQKVLSQNLDLVSNLMGQRLAIMTDLVGNVLPKLSIEDRRKLGLVK